MERSEKSFGKFMLLWSGGLISAIGSGLTSFGLGVYVFEKTGMASATAMVMLLAFLPAVLLSAFAGVLADRYDRRLLMILGDGLSAIGLVYILICLGDGDAALWQIGIGVTISSVFSSLLEPAFRATITDLLTKEQFAKASGLVQVSGSARYLISPLLAGLLLTAFDIRALLIIDICTLAVTMVATMVVRRGLAAQRIEQEASLLRAFKDGWRVIAKNRGIFTLVWMSTMVTLCLGVIQTLAGPLLLSFADKATLGAVETIAAFGMLVSSVLLGVLPIKGKHTLWLSGSLFLTGIFMVLFGLRENVVLIGAAGFFFFAMLPFANTSLDYLLRTNVENEYQGRVWGLVGVISQLGYVAAYALSGLLADYLFTPLLLGSGVLSASIGRLMGTGSGRGIGFLIAVAGVLLCMAAIAVYRSKSIRTLEYGRVSA